MVGYLIYSNWVLFKIFEIPPCPHAFENSLSYECQTLTNCSHQYHLQNPKYCFFIISSDVKKYLMGGCNGWVFERVKLAQGSLLPMGSPHRVSQYNLSPSPESQPSRRPQGQGRNPAGQLTKVREECWHYWTHSKGSGREILKYSDQLNMFDEGKTLPKCNKCNNVITGKHCLLHNEDWTTW